MQYYDQLPQNYTKVFTVDFEQNPEQIRAICIIALLVLALFIPLGIAFVPLSAIMPNGFSLVALLWLLLKILIGTAGVFLYIVLHELTHGVFIRLFSKKKARYGHNGCMYAYAYCEGYFAKGAYLTIALGPVVLWTLLLGALCLAVPAQWFWVAYAVQLTNVSGAAGDLYVTGRFAALPKHLLTKDDGARMECYAPEKK